ncbi:MAG: DUF2069 domain-containing protein [Cellvibrionaceae bacterium]
MNNTDTHNADIKNAATENNEDTTAKPFTPSNPQHLFLVKSATWIAYLGMLAIISWVNLTEETGSWVRWCIQSFPLLMVLPGMIMKKYRAFSWLCFIIVMYFIPSVMKVMDPQGEWLDTLMLVFCIIIFITSAYTSRWMQRLIKTKH